MCNPALTRGSEKAMRETIGEVFMRSVDEDQCYFLDFHNWTTVIQDIKI